MAFLQSHAECREGGVPYCLQVWSLQRMKAGRSLPWAGLLDSEGSEDLLPSRNPALPLRQGGGRVSVPASPARAGAVQKAQSNSPEDKHPRLHLNLGGLGASPSGFRHGALGQAPSVVLQAPGSRSLSQAFGLIHCGALLAGAKSVQLNCRRAVAPWKLTCWAVGQGSHTSGRWCR